MVQAREGAGKQTKTVLNATWTKSLGTAIIYYFSLMTEA
jgi:hypothetical protein